MHATQTPAPSHTPPGQFVPALAEPVALQSGVPVEHEVVPVWHGLLGVQLTPAVHPLQRPAPSQTPPAHGKPLDALLANVHTGIPVSHRMLPIVQGFPVAQDIPVLHAMHVPLPSHTPPLHAAPAVRCVPA